MKSKMNKANLDKTLEELERSNWGEPNFPSYLVTTCHKLRRKKLKDFTVEDLRIMIGQNIGLPFLMPLAIEILKESPLAAGDFYAGDLLNSVLSIETEFWQRNVELWQDVEHIISGLESEHEWIRSVVLKNAEQFRYQAFAALPESQRKINYDNRRFVPVTNSESGEVSGETVFHYRQKNAVVWATYKGGAIKFGTLVARVSETNELEMRYSHVNETGELMTGICHSTPEVLPDGRIRLYEKWQWTSGDHSEGESVVEEIKQ